MDVSRIRTAVGWTIAWFVIAGVVSLPLAAVKMPYGGDPCRNLFADPAWAAWIFRDVLWFSLAVCLPVSAAITAVLAWRSELSVRRCTAIGAGIGLALVLASVVSSMATATCRVEIHLY